MPSKPTHLVRVPGDRALAAASDLDIEQPFTTQRLISVAAGQAGVGMRLWRWCLHLSRRWSDPEQALGQRARPAGKATPAVDTRRIGFRKAHRFWANSRQTDTSLNSVLTPLFRGPEDAETRPLGPGSEFNLALRPLLKKSGVVPRAGVEPARPCGHRVLRPPRLPVPPPRRGRNGARQYHWPMRIAAILGLCMLLSACGLTGALPSTTPVAGTTSPPRQRASAPRITPPPVSPPQPPANVAAFQCADASGGVTGTANLTDVRVREQTGFDRFVMQFDTRVPTYTVKRQAKPVFKTGGNGQALALRGAAGG